MKTLAPFLLLLAACRAPSPPFGEPAHVTIYGDEPRLETWRAFVAEGVHAHSRSPGSCPIEMFETFLKSSELRLDASRSMKAMCAIMGPAHGGPGRLTLLLAPPDDGLDEALAVDVPLLAADETERTFTLPGISVELERPAGTRKASIDRGRVTVRRISAGRYDVELFAVLKPGGAQVVARAQAGGVP